MSSGVFFAVLCAALLHASWNAIIKFGDNKVLGMILLSIAHGAAGLVMILYFPAPKPAAWGWLAVSVLLHWLYKYCLTLAYSHGDLSRVYPISRGTAPVLVMLAGFVLLPDHLSSVQIIAIILLALGILQMARGVFVYGVSLQLLPFALGAALGTAGYTIADGMGARASGNVSGFVGWLFFLDGTLFAIWGIYRGGREVLSRSRRLWVVGLAAGVASVAAYWIAVWAMTVAPIALVAALRETSVLFAVLIGIVVLGERSDPRKIIAAILIATGVVLIRI